MIFSRIDVVYQERYFTLKLISKHYLNQKRLRHSGTQSEYLTAYSPGLANDSNYKTPLETWNYYHDILLNVSKF